MLRDIDCDFVIVGAGSAGCVLAERLSQNGRFKVVVVEAGGSDARFWIKVPIGYAINYANPDLNWGYHSQPDQGLSGRRVYWPRGRVVGGSSSINAMAYMRGLPHDFDDWERAGATGWGWEEVRPAYEWMERHAGPNGVKGSGPVWVSDLSDQMHPFADLFLKAATDCGWENLPDLNGIQSEGLGRYRSTVRRGRRWSAADAFLKPALRRRNLRLLKRAQVRRVMFDGKRASGVELERNGQQIRIYARSAVVLSAGAVNSPQILQLSGIGPAALLQRHGIPVRHDLVGVGDGMQDHLAVSYQFYAAAPTLNSVLGTRLGRMTAGMRYLLTGRGSLAVPVNQVGGYLRSHLGAATPDVQLFCNPASYHVNAAGQTILDQRDGYLLSVQPCRPTSRGRIQIASTDHRDAPLIEPNSLATMADQVNAVRAVKLLRRLADAPALQGVTTGAKSPSLATLKDDQILEDFRNRASTVYHPCGTCRMGNAATGAVLDARLRVQGISGLRVVDASAFPNITSGNTNAPVMMLAMRAAEMILEDTL